MIHADSIKRTSLTRSFGPVKYWAVAIPSESAKSNGESE